MTKGKSNLRTEICSEFPVLVKQLQKCDQSAYSVLSIFAGFINDALERSDVATVEQAMQLAEALYERADDTVRNAFYCDFCEVLDLRGEMGMKVFLKMSAGLQALHSKAQDYIEQ